MDADGVGGRSERCCTTTTVAALIATPAIEKIPRRVFSRGCWWQPDWAVPPRDFRTRKTGGSSTIAAGRAMLALPHNMAQPHSR
jgi:hypothetical protein